MSIRRKKTFLKESKSLSEKIDIPWLNTSTPAKVKKPPKVFVEDKVFYATLLSILEKVNRKIDIQDNNKREKKKELEEAKRARQIKRETKELDRKNKKQKRWEDAIAKVKQKKRFSR
ncbi:hypothetical protein PORY_002515 [Pneumocystis oryctolagi]|uniref:Uncharacterized protein n=1 Tax=Pneumocystis oryctolagi TaxID=42067 RepID=A0ACB7C9G3_9ASCO|nr:hypothetical protein PORY_002515 [Pneumocystis oryctolagi]